MNDIIYSPRSGEEVKRATGNIPIYTYSDLSKKSEKIGSKKVLNEMFNKSLKNIILLQDPDNMNSGHWFSISLNPHKHEIYFFSTYGGKPDQEKNRWIDKTHLTRSQQVVDLFNDGLQQLQKEGWVIHYNDHKYQHEGDHTSTCGIYTAAFLNSNLNPDEFYEQTKLISGNPAVEYYRRYFL